MDKAGPNYWVSAGDSASSRWTIELVGRPERYRLIDMHAKLSSRNRVRYFDTFEQAVAVTR